MGFEPEELSCKEQKTEVEQCELWMRDMLQADVDK